ncbi:class E sortase [Candidatus Woesebacteria bacterium]|jgi:LPXTG-site transpeptidase (sortase) family protein|nr:class E sortase [Candidatus Woesebacteria bacterium]
MDFTWATKLRTPKRPIHKFGHLYYAGSGLSYGEVILIEPKRGRAQEISFFISALLVSFALTSLLTTFAPSNYIELPDEYQTQVPVARASSENGSAKDEANALGLSASFSLSIPKIYAYADIVDNVDVSNEVIYKDALTKGVAHAQGTGYPGENKRIFLFAHSTDSLVNFSKYNAIFYDLRKLVVGDVIYIYYQDVKYTYEVTDRKIVSASDVSFLNPEEGPTMILQTCDPPGTTWKRLLVFARLKGAS